MPNFFHSPCRELARLCFALALLLGPAFSLQASPVVVRGQIIDKETRQPLEDAVIGLPALGRVVRSDALGVFSLPSLEPGSYLLSISHLGYASQEITIQVRPGGTNSLSIELAPAPLQLADVTISREDGRLSGLTAISALDLELRPLRSSQDALRYVPGLFIAQHAGGGKAEQIFLRGFDIDHGTDIALTVDGMPVNMVSHAHGQGYADLHFLIPETIERINFDKGMYEAEQGNFNTAGYAGFETKNALESSVVKLELGQFNTYRGLAMLDLLPGNSRHHAYVATEYLYSDGYFEASQLFDRVNFLAKYSGLINDNTVLSASVSAFTSQWDASGQIPDRAVEQGLISRFGAIDSTEGGNTARRNLNLSLIRYLDNEAILRQRVFFSQYDFSLFSNFTFFLEDSVNGDQIHQEESRNIYGYQGSWEKTWMLGGIRTRTEAGVGLRVDDVQDNALSKTVNRTDIVERLAFGDVREWNASAYLSQYFWLGNKWTLDLGLRYDQFSFAYQNQLTPAYDPRQAAKGIVSPKAKLAFQASEGLRLFVNAGTGFHSNDTRVILEQTGRDILPRAYGADLGLIVKPTQQLLIQAALWNLFLDQEFVYVGDAAIVEPSGRTARMGLEATIRYQLTPWLFADADLNYTLARAVEEAESENQIPLAPRFSSIGGLHANWNAVSASLRYRHLGDRPANEDGSLIAEGYTLIDAVLRWQLGKVELSLSAENILDQDWKEAQFETESRLQGEAASVTEIHFTPGAPRFVRLGAAYHF